MSDSITLPTPDKIADRIRACREELVALRRLHRLSKAAQVAQDARDRCGAVIEPDREGASASR
jgi:hypothetical protein